MDRELQALSSAMSPQRFERSAVLRADELNRAFGSAAAYARLCAAAPPAAGLFRPWWWPTEKVNKFESGNRGRSVTIAAPLFASLPNGAPVVVETTRLELESHGAVAIGADGKARPSGETRHGRDVLILGKHDDGTNNFEFTVPVAAMDATEALKCENDRVAGAAAAWRDKAAETDGHASLARTFHDIVGGDWRRTRRTEALRSAAESVRSRLRRRWGESDPDVENLHALLKRPSNEYDKLLEWLKRWAYVFCSPELRHGFFAREQFRCAKPDNSGTDGAGRKRWVVDFGSAPGNCVELESPERLVDEALYSFGRSGDGAYMNGPVRTVDGKHRTTLMRPDRSANPLLIRTRAKALRWRVCDAKETGQ